MRRAAAAAAAVAAWCAAAASAACGAPNEGPSPDLPVAATYLPLAPTADGLHWLASVSVGSPAQDMSLVVDTGSSRMVLFEPPFCSEPGGGVAAPPGPCFDSDASSTLRPLTGVAEPFGLAVDGETLTSGGALLQGFGDAAALAYGVDGLGLAADPAPAANASFFLADALRVEPADGVPDGGGLHTFAYSHGVLGASYEGGSGAPSPFAALLDGFAFDEEDRAAGLPVFSLDLRAEGSTEPSRLDVGGPSAAFADSLVWGERRPDPAELHELVLHDFRLCGNAITANSSVGSSRAALVDTGAACLGLPAEMFDSVFSYVPAECDTLDRCYLPAGVPAALPTLSFSLSAGGEQLHVRMEDLLLPPARVSAAVGVRQRYCVVRRAAESEESANTVSLGTRVLVSLYATMHMTRRQVALANKAAFEPSDLQCRANVLCSGMQWREVGTNTCRDPKCGDYYFFERSDDGESCRLSAAFHATAVVLILTVIAGELALHEWTRSVTSRVAKSVRDA